MLHDHDHRRWAVRSVLCVAIAIGLSACGGGGGGTNVRPAPPPSTPSTPPPPPPPTDTQEQPGFADHLTLTKADQTIAAGLTGAGVTIGFVDTGVNRNHPALAGRVLQNFIHVGSDNDLSVDDSVGHGTTVASLAAGGAVAQWPGGIAQDATVVSSRIISDQPPEDDGSGEGNEVTAGEGYGAFFAAINTELADAGASIINNSWGGLYWTDPGMTKEFADAYRDFVITRGGLIVFANGNAGDDPELRPNPSDNAALPSIDPYAADLEQGWLTVAALDPLRPGSLTDYSQECGIAMNYCLAAPGNVVFTGFDDLEGDPTYWVGGGTSYAAPLVAGAAAVVWSIFPYFDNDLVRQTILGGARDIGEPGVDTVFGWGLLDVAKAAGGPSTFAWGDVTVDFEGTSTWSNWITGDGGLVKQGSGTLVLTETPGYTGDTRVEGGTLQLVTGMSGSSVTIGPGAVLQGGGGISKDVTNHGTYVVGGPDGTFMSIAGNYTQGPDGTLAEYIGAPLEVVGTATLQGGDLHVLGVVDGYTATSSELMLRTVAGVTGTFDTYSAATGVLVEGSLRYEPTSVWFDLTRLEVDAAAQAMGLTAASISGATRVESAFDLLDGSTAVAAPSFVEAAGQLQQAANAAAAERALSSLSGEIHATDGAMAMLAMDGSRHALEQRLDAQPKAGGWMASLDVRHDLGGIGASLSGWMLGQELRSGNTTWGATVSRSEGTLWSGLRNDRGLELRSEGQLYAVHDLGAGYLMGSTSFGRVQRDLQRELVLGHGLHVDSRYVDRHVGVSLQAGRHLAVGGGTLTPYAGAQSLHLQRGAFDEAGGAGFGLRADASGFDVTQALLGTRYRQSWSLGSALLDLHGRLEWQRTLSANGTIQASFTGIDASAPIALQALGRDTGIFSAGLGATWRNTRLSLDVDARNTLGTTDLGAQATWQVAF